MARSLCVTEGCIRPKHARGMCPACYQRWARVTPPEQRRRRTIAERFNAKVEQRGPNECWPFTGYKKYGYGHFFVSPERGLVMAPAFALELATGERCPPGREGCHHCDNPPCCNPAHVYYGTRKQNMEDCTRRGRRPLGERSPAAVLTEGQVITIRERTAAGAGPGILAAEFGIHRNSVLEIVRGDSWSHAGGPIRPKYVPKAGRPKRERVIVNCKVEGCIHTAAAGRKEMCEAHYQRCWKYGNPGAAQINNTRYRGALCRIEGCDQKAAARTLCPMHYRRWKKSGDPLKVDI